ncbi:WD repeat-containing protein 43 isoform X2 [Tripterygium wilfordii]|uniref:WD repeat-containing protein 43 isoform X2 n=1 Tax=Tripterygium wilfordii TaxID=458696 RepID=UPI0018F83E7C|nr:WD repeat-containing protein 43 isoform X2 [Tripterygium wilfordii]
MHEVVVSGHQSMIEKSNKKRKLGCSLLVLGTGSGDIVAFDVSAGQLKWIVSDCHPGGVSAISFSTNGSCIYSAGEDGMICKIDPLTGNFLEKFKASTKAISSISVSPDGKILASAASQLKTFDCSKQKKIQKFSGHPGAVRCMQFSEDGKYILSSAVGERYVALWRADGGKKRSASYVLAMEHPAVLLDSRCSDTGLFVLAISETGVCYIWYGQNVEDLRNAKPTKVSLDHETFHLKNHKGALPAVFAAKLLGIAKPTSGHVFIAYGLPVKPLFQKLLVHSGMDVKLNVSPDGVFLPINQSLMKTKRGQGARSGVTALDRANVEDALLPLPKVFDNNEKIRRQTLSFETDELMVDAVERSGQANLADNKDGLMDVDAVIICMEERLRSLGVLSSKDDRTLNSALDSTKFRGIDLEANLTHKKMRATVLSMEPNDAYEFLGVLVSIWQSRSGSGQYVLPWIYSILVNHSHYVMAQEPITQLLNSLYKMSKSKGESVQPLLQLSGRLQLVTVQIDKAALNNAQSVGRNDQMDDNEDEDDDVDEHLYGEDDDESQLSSDDDN